MLNIIPENPTPAQQRIINSDWFQSALQEANEVEDQTPSYSVTSNEFIREVSTSNTSSNARFMIFWDNHVFSQPQEVLNDRAYWLSMLHVAQIFRLSISYHNTNQHTLFELIIALHILHPHMENIYPRQLYSLMSYHQNDWDILEDLFRKARQEIQRNSQLTQTVKSLMLHTTKLNEHIKSTLRQAVHATFYPDNTQRNPSRLPFEFKFQNIDAHPVTLLTYCVKDVLFQDVNYFIRTASPRAKARLNYMAARVIWCLIYNFLLGTAHHTQAREHYTALLAYFISMAPIKFTKKDDAMYFHRPAYYLNTYALNQSSALLTQSGQLSIAKEVLFSTYSKGQWNDITKACIKHNIDFGNAALNLWVFGTKAHRITILEDYITNHAKKQDKVDVITDAITLKPKKAQFDVITALLNQLKSPLASEQQQQLAIAAITHLSSKQQSQILAFTPDADLDTIPKPAKTTAPKTNKKKATKKTKEDVHTVLEGIKAKKLPKTIDASWANELEWSDEKRALNDTEFKTLITVLRDSGPDGAFHPQLPVIANALNTQQANDFGFKLLTSWESNEAPAKDKWMLFQLRHLGIKKNVTALGKNYYWESMASSGKWARATWYLEVISDMGPSRENDKLFINLLDAGKIDSTLQHTARQIFPKFAHSLGLSDVHKYFEQRGLLGHVPKPKKLSFKPGETEVTLDSNTYTLIVDQAQLKLLRQKDSHKTNISEELTNDSKIKSYSDEVNKQAILWGAYYERMHRLKQSYTASQATKDLSSLGPVHQNIFCSLLWQDDNQHIFRFDPDGTAFDVEYDPVSLEPKSSIQLISPEQLKKKLQSQWVEHLTEAEVILPFDVMDGAYYLKGIKQLIEAPFDDSKEYDHVIWALSDLGYNEGHPEDAGIIYTHYKTFKNYNTRVFIDHSGISVSNGEVFETPGTINGISFRDLLNHSIPDDKVEPGVLSIVYNDLAEFKKLV